MIKRLTLLTLITFFSVCLFAREQITEFTSVIRPDNDGCVHIIEHITFNAEDHHVNRGIYRAVPTRYSWGPFWNNIDFELQSILLDGRPAGHRFRQIGQGVVIDIGQSGNDFDNLLWLGSHTVEIRYTLCRVFRFFDKHDELYLNVTGLDWSLPIEHTTAVIQLDGLSSALRGIVAYTGALGSRTRDYRLEKSDDEIQIITSKPLMPGQGLTVALALEKGTVKEPSQLQMISSFFRDNCVIALGLFLLFLLLFFTAYVIYQQKKKRYNTPIIARFSPPAGYTPGQLRYLLTQKIDPVCMAADIVYAAITGLLTIKLLEKDTLFGSSSYELSRVVPIDKEQIKEPDNPVLKTLVSTLFGRTDTVALHVDAAKVVYTALQSLLQVYCRLRDLTMQGYGIRLPKESFTYALMPLLLFAVWVSAPYAQDLWFVIFFTIAVFVLGAISVTYGWAYDVRGRELVTHAKGFELYLKTAEVERLKYTGTPPERTPELYERFLPYAIALGVEKEWSKQFVPVFERLVRQGKAHDMLWLEGDQRKISRIAYLGSNLSGGLTRAINRAVAPAAKGIFSGGSGTWSGGSGFGGGGFSGGGSGGGGGGGR